MFTIERRVLGIKTFEHWFEYNETQNSIFTLNPQLYIAGEVPKKYFQIKRTSYSIVNYLDMSEENLYQCFNKTYKYQIQKAAKEGITCTIDNHYENFLSIYNQLAKQKGLPKKDLNRLQSVESNLLISFASINNEPIVTHSYITDKKVGVARLWDSASRRFESTADNFQIGMANKLLHYKDMLYFKDKGFKVYDFGGYYEDKTNDSLQNINKFKLSFGGEKIKYSSYFSPTCLIFRKTSQLVEKAKKQVSFLPMVFQSLRLPKKTISYSF